MDQTNFERCKHVSKIYLTKIRLPFNYKALSRAPSTEKNTKNNNNKGSKIRTGPLYCSIVGTVKIIKAVRLELGHYTIV